LTKLRPKFRGFVFLEHGVEGFSQASRWKVVGPAVCFRGIEEHRVVLVWKNCCDLYDNLGMSTIHYPAFSKLEMTF